MPQARRPAICRTPDRGGILRLSTIREKLLARKLVFHIGLAKTGTTSFQRFCRDHRRLLRRHGVLYPRRQLGRAANHSPLVASYIAHRPEGPTVAMRWVPRAQAVRSLAAEIEASPCQTVLVSSEHFSTHFDRSEARDLAEDFARFEPTVVITVREPHGRFLSSYNTHVTAGGRLPLEDYARSMLVPGTRFMSVRETILIWQEAFGADRVSIVDYDAVPEVTAAILRHCGIAEAVPSVDRHRVSLDADTVEALRCANAAIVARQAVPPDASLAAWLQLSAFSILCRRHLAGLPRGGAGRPWAVSERTLAELDALEASDREWLAATCGLDLHGSRARERLVVADPVPVNEAQMLLAHALVERIAGRWWAPSQRAVMLFDRFMAARAATDAATAR